MDKDIIKLIEEKMNCKVLNCFAVGRGGSASVYRTQINVAPYSVAVKINDIPSLIYDEYNSIEFISSRADCKLPKLYFAQTVNGKGVLAMELIEGVTASAKNLIFRKNKAKLANEIVDNLIKIHSVHNDKYGLISDASYDSWYEYYGDFAKGIVDFTNGSDVPEIVKTAVNSAYDRRRQIIGAGVGKPTLAHGDYWLPNFIIDNKTMSLRGVIDPFNVSWTEPEYELFTLTVGYGRNLHLYDIYKSKVKTTANCDIKVEMYALFNELNWCKILGEIDFHYLKYRSKRLLKMMSKL